jgi:hypothetical protein
LLLCVANPLIFPALRVGHPEEILGAVLCTAAVVCALDDRPLWAGILLGLAVANKEWAVLSAGPLLLALPRARVRAVIASGVTAGAVMAPLLLATSGGFANTTSAVGTSTGGIFMPWQWWYFFGSHFHPAATLHYNLAHLYRKPPTWLGGLGHILPVALMPPLTALYAWLRRGARERHQDVLLLLTLVFALRCVLDPWDISYYALPFVFALTAWDGLDAPRVPYMAVMGTLTAWFILVRTGASGLFLSSDLQALVFMLVTIPAIPAIALRVFAPDVAPRLVPRLRPAAAADPVPTTA